jgi:ABC-type lipoprotein release transport system permease subunit
MGPLTIAKLAWRNLGRNLRRTLITASAISLSLALLIFSSALGDGFHGEMIRAGVSQMAGHVVVQAAGYQQKPESDKVVPGAKALEAKLGQWVPRATVVPRIFLEGLLTSPANSVGVQVEGVVAPLEAKVNDFHEKIEKGENLAEGDDRGILIGQTLAETLQVGLGDKVVLMAQRKGDIESRLFRVRGVFHTGSGELDGFYAQIPLAAAQQLLGVGDGVNQLSLHLKDESRTGQVTAEVQRALQGQPVEVLTWQQALPELHQFVVLDDGSLYVIIVIIALIVVLGILNTVLMSVLERSHEFGVLLAIGMSGKRLAAMVLTESFLIGLLAALAGAGLGALLAWPLDVYGLDWSKVMGSGTEIGGVTVKNVIKGDLSWVKLVFFSSLACALTVVSSLYPMLKAARLQPVEAMHQH